MSVGRNHELTQPWRLLKRGVSAPVVCPDRRHIGKSTPVEQFALAPADLWNKDRANPRSYVKLLRLLHVERVINQGVELRDVLDAP